MFCRSTSGGLYFFLAVAGAACFLLSMVTCCCFCCQRRPGAAPKLSRKEKKKMQQVGSTHNTFQTSVLACARLSGHDPHRQGRLAGGVHGEWPRLLLWWCSFTLQHQHCVWLRSCPDASLFSCAGRSLTAQVSMCYLFLLCRSSSCPLLPQMPPSRPQPQQAAMQSPTPTSIQPTALTQSQTSSPAWHTCNQTNKQATQQRDAESELKASMSTCSLWRTLPLMQSCCLAALLCCCS